MYKNKKNLQQILGKRLLFYVIVVFVIEILKNIAREF